MAKKDITCTVNGKVRTYSVDVRESLYDMLRGQAGLDIIKHRCDVGE
jgi:carbon-monoxide dehydrogenase small subunit